MHTWREHDRAAVEDTPSSRWQNASPLPNVPPLQSYGPIEVVPAKEMHFHALMFDGGPVWPDFDTNPVIRHAKNNTFIDRNATPVPGTNDRLDRAALWGGRAYFHFGHLVTEHVNRIPASLFHRPDDLVLFTLPPGKVPGDVPGYFWAVTGWLGLPRGKVRFVTRPFVAEELRVAPQAEQLDRCTPPGYYLDLLDENFRLSGVTPVANDILFVTRTGQLALGNGASAGEGALVAALGRAGVPVMDPAVESLERQMALYAGAKVLIFSEGSAMHGRQLLGRVDQKIVVLLRRPGSIMAKPMLTPRCREIEYFSPIAGFAQPVAKGGGVLRPQGMAFYDLDVLFAAFRAHGVDLAPHWRAAEFEAAEEAEAAAWYGQIRRRAGLDPDLTHAALAPVFEERGRACLLQR